MQLINLGYQLLIVHRQTGHADIKHICLCVVHSGVDANNNCSVHQCIHSVHEYQTSEAGAIIESNFKQLRCFSLSLYSF